MDQHVRFTPVLKQRSRRGRNIWILRLACMGNDSVDHDKLCVCSCGIAETSKHPYSILIGPVVHDETQKKDVGRFEEPRLRFKEVMADKFNLALLDGGWQVLFPILMMEVEHGVSTMIYVFGAPE